MKLIQAKNYEDLSKKAAEFIANVVNEKKNAVLGLATGGTPEGTYKELVALYNDKKVDFAGVKSVNLDEYVGLAKDHEQSYNAYMEDHFFKHVNMAETNLPNGQAEDAVAECKAYEEKIKALGGVDMQLLGIGHNGHIGFNEPSDAFPAETHVVKLDATTLKANSVYFGSLDAMPKYAYTMGIGTILKAKKILMLVTGKAKAEILYKTLTMETTTQVPSTVLGFHMNVTIIADEEALSVIKEKKPELLA